MENEPTLDDPTEVIPEPAEAEQPAEATPEPERRESRAEERIAQQAAEIRQLQDALALTQQMQREQMARAQGVDPKTKEYADHPYTQFLSQQVQAATLPILDRQDRTDAELFVTKKYGEETWDLLEADVEREHQAYLQRGQWAERGKLVYVIAGQKGIKLEPKAQRRETEQRQTRARAARSASVETGAPARRSDSTPAPPIFSMEKSKRDAALAEHIAKQGGF